MRPVNALERRPVELEAISRRAGLEIDRAGQHVEPPHDELVPLDAFEQLVEAAPRAERFQHEVECAAARQSRTSRFFGADPVAGGRRFVFGELPGTHAGNHVVFDTSAGHRTGDDAIVTDRGERADRTRRRAPRVHDRDEDDATAVRHPLTGASQDLQIDAVQSVSPAGTPHAACNGRCRRIIGISR
jgi:hypothetical protein